MDNKKPLILVDGSSYLFRAYHALPPLTTTKGMPTGALYGVLNMIKKLINQSHPEYMGIVFDTKSKNHRHDLFPAYKANRPEMPPDLAQQIEPLHAIIRALGITVIAVEGVEADDVIGTLAHQAREQGRSVIISTGDKDFAQLVSEEITLVNTMSDSVLDRQGVIDKFGVPPEHIVDYLALMGDTVDNIPGVDKVGPKTALKWLQTYGSLDGIIQNAHHISGKVGENLRLALGELPLYKTLVTIDCHKVLPVTCEGLRCVDPALSQLEDFYKEYEFKSWLKELQSLGSVAEANTFEQITHYQCLQTETAVLDYLKGISQSTWLSLDLETTALDPITAEIVGVSLATETAGSVYIPCAHHADLGPQVSCAWLLKILSPIFNNPNIKKIGHNLKYDYSVLREKGIILSGMACDTMLASYVYNSVATKHDLGSVAKRYLNREGLSFESVVAKGENFSSVPLDKATQYSAEDADFSLQLAGYFLHQLKTTPTLKHVLVEIELPLVPVLSMIERRGVLVDRDLLESQSHALGERCKTLEETAILLAGEPFNLQSPKQLQGILYEKLGLPILQKTPTGQPSTGEVVLQELALQYELPKVILEHRTLMKLKSTYTDSLPQQIHPKTGRVHTSYHQAVTSTGRLSSSHPNLQNIPVRTVEGRQIREAFIASPGYVLLSADYSQIELRIMAHLSKDKGLLKAFHAGKDIHTATASEIFNIPLEEVTSLQRRHAKTINFGLIYGMSSFGLAKQLGVTRQTAAAYMEHYFNRYPGVKVFMETIRLQAFEQGFVETLAGRRLYLPEIRSKNMMLRKAAERTAINAPMQGTAADIIKTAMIQVAQWIEKTTGRAHLIMQVHDELVFELEESILEEAQAIIVQVMEGAGALEVPLIVDVGVGANWEAAHR